MLVVCAAKRRVEQREAGNVESILDGFGIDRLSISFKNFVFLTENIP